MRTLTLSLLGASLAVLLTTSAHAQRRDVQWTVSRANFDTPCGPCTDFFRYVNGGWVKRASIPAVYPMWGSFYAIVDRTDSVLHRIVEDAREDTTAAGTARKVGLFYGTCMDSVRAEADGIAPIRPMLQRIGALRTAKDVTGMIVELYARGIGALFGFGAGEDPKDRNTIIAFASQGGLGLPDRGYYDRSDSAARRLRRDYAGYVGELFRLAGQQAPRARRDAASVLALESRLAAVSLTSVQFRDPNAIYHKMTVRELQALTPHFDWSRYLRAVGAPQVTAIDVTHPPFFKAIDGLLLSVPVPTWKAYLRARVLRTAAPSLDSAFVNEDFHYQRNFTGATSMLPRWQRCLGQTSHGALGEAVGQEYVKRTFPPEAKARVTEMVGNLKAALRDRIEQLAWMSSATKQEALAKLDSLALKVGYPDKWRDYSTLEVATGPFFDNQLRAGRWDQARDFAKIGKPVDRAEWGGPPQTVDAYAGSNEIVFPAGLLQPPFFDLEADDAVNYGAMGSVIGHELTHHFDDRGRQYDAAGNLRGWWTKADAVAYGRRAQLVVAQFDAYTVLDSATHVNGKLTLGENLSDLGGLKIAYVALQKAIAARGRPPLVDGFTAEQRFFLGWAAAWRSITRPEYQRAHLATDQHAPWELRVNAPLSNLPEFARAFGCRPGNPMVRPDSLRAEIW